MRHVFNVVLGLVMILAILALLVIGLIRGLEDNPALVISVITAGFTVGGSIYAVGYQARTERRDEAARIHREKISGYYEQLIKFLFDVAKREGEEGLTDDDLEFMRELAQKMLLWSGPGLVSAWSAWLRLLATEPPAEQAMVGYGRTLKAIRGELGHDDSALDLRDLLHLFVTDIDEHLPQGLK